MAATDLFVVTSGLPADMVLGAVPPACRRPLDTAPPPATDGADVVLEFGPWRPRQPVRHLVPALGVLGAPAPAFRFELSAQRDGRWLPWVGTVALGAPAFAPIADAAEEITAEVDVWTAAVPVEAVRLRLRLPAGAARTLAAAPWLVTLSASDGAAPAPAPVEGKVCLRVPAFSQMESDPALAPRICSPTSVAMVLGYLGADDDPVRLAAEIFHPALDLYGLWPAAIAAGARRGVAGYLLRFPDWAAAAWCLRRGLPIVASIRYARGELTGAAVPETRGHLVVLTGYAASEVLVNDPAAPSAAAVPRRYRLAELERVWLARSGVGYVFFTVPGAAAAAPPARPG